MGFVKCKPPTRLSGVVVISHKQSLGLGLHSTLSWSFYLAVALQHWSPNMVL